MNEAVNNAIAAETAELLQVGAPALSPASRERFRPEVLGLLVQLAGDGSGPAHDAEVAVVTQRQDDDAARVVCDSRPRLAHLT